MNIFFTMILLLTATPAISAQTTCPGAEINQLEKNRWNAAGALITTNGNRTWLGTAFMISDRFLLTARHNVATVNAIKNYFWIGEFYPIPNSTILFVPGALEIDKDAIERHGREALVVDFGRSRSTGDDWAILRLREPLPNLDYFELSRASKESLFSLPLRTGGYSCSDGPTKKFRVFDGAIEDTVESLVYGPMVKGFETSRGHSGGPVLVQNSDGKWNAVGILTRGSAFSGSGIAISDRFFDTVERILKKEEKLKNAPPGRARL